MRGQHAGTGTACGDRQLTYKLATLNIEHSSQGQSHNIIPCTLMRQGQCWCSHSRT